MADEFEIARSVYKIEVAGLQDAEAQLNAFVDKIKAFNDTLTQLKTTLSSATSSGNTSDITALTSKIKDLEAEIEKLQAKEAAARKEIGALTAAQKTNASSSDVLNRATAASGTTAEKVAGQFKTYAQAIAAVNAARKEAKDVGEPVAIKGVSDEGLKLSVFSANQLKELEKELNTLSALYNEELGKTPNVINKANVATEESIALKQREIALLNQAILNTSSAQITNPFSGLPQEVETVRLRIVELRNEIINLSTSANTIQRLTEQQKLLVDVSKQLTVSEDNLRLSIGVEQWQKYTEILKGIVPGIQALSIEEFNAGEAGNVVNNAISENNLKLQDYSKSLKSASVDIQAFKNDVNELGNAIQTALKNEATTVTFKGNTIPLKEALSDYSQMSVQLDAIKQKTSDIIGVTSQLNSVDEESVTTLKRERLEIEEILRNRKLGSTTVFLQGDEEVSIQSAIDKRNKLKAAEDSLAQSIKLRDLAVKASADGLDGLDAKAKLLELTFRSLNGKLSENQFAELKTNLNGIIPELDKMSLADLNAGKAEKLFQDATFNANKEVKDQQRLLSGRNTLVGDYTKGIVDAFKSSGLTDVLSDSRVQLQSTIVSQTIKISELKTQYQQLKVTGGEAFENIKAKLNDAIKEQATLIAQSKNLNSAFRESGTLGSQVANSISSGFENLGRRIAQTVGIYFGFQAAISGITKAINIDREITDKFADLQRVLGGTKEGIDGVVDSLRKIDTRTPINQLADMAVIAAKAGVAKDDIAGVTEAMNRLKLVVGKDFGGDIESATNNIIKLVNIFIGPGQATGENITKISNALVSLDQAGVATADFITKFAEEMSGIQGITKIGLASVTGLGAAFQETGIRAEVSSTAISQILIRIGANIGKFAALTNNVKIADVTTQQVDAFRQLIRDNPGEALIQLAVGLKRNKENFDEFGQAFSDLGAKGFKVTSVFGDLADKADFFRSKIELAKNALQGQNVILDGAALKEENLAGVTDKIGAEIQLAFTNPKFIDAVKGFGELILNVTKALTSIPFEGIVAGIATISVAWLLFKIKISDTSAILKIFGGELGTQRLINLALKNGVLSQAEAEALRGKITAASINTQGNMRKAIELRILQEGLLTKASVLQKDAEIARNTVGIQTEAVLQKENIAKAAGVLGNKAFAVSEEAAATATDIFNVAVKASPLGIILSVLGLLIPILSAFGSKMDDTTKKIDDQNKSLDFNVRLQKIISENFSKSLVETQKKVEILVATLKDENLSLETRKAAYEALIAISPSFQGSANDDAKSVSDLRVDVDKLNISLQTFITNLNEAATAQAFGKLRTEAISSLSDIITQQVKNESKQKELESDLTDFTKKEINKRYNALSDADKKRFENIAKQRAIPGGVAPTAQAVFAEDEVISPLDRIRKERELADLQKEDDQLKIDRAKQEKITQATLLTVQEETDLLSATVEVNQKHQTDIEKRIGVIQTSAKKEETQRLKNLKTAQDEFNSLDSQIRTAEKTNNTALIKSLDGKLIAARKDVEKYSQITGTEKELSDLTTEDVQLRAQIVERKKNVLAMSGIELEDAQRHIDSTIKNVKSLSDVIAILEAERDKYNEKIALTIEQIESVNNDVAQTRLLEQKLKDLIAARNLVNRKLKELGETSGTDSLSKAEQSEIKALEAHKQLALALEEQRFAAIKATRKPELEEEETFNRNILNITTFWNQKKIDAINGERSIEKLSRAQFFKQTEDLELSTNERIIQIRQNFVNEDARVARKHLDSIKAQQSEQLTVIQQLQQSGSSSFEEVAAAHKRNTDILMQQTFKEYSTLIAEATNFGLNTEALEEERMKRISEIEKEGLLASREIYDAYFKDIDKGFKDSLSNTVDQLNTMRDAVLSSNLSPAQQTTQLNQIQKVQKIVEAISELKRTTNDWRIKQAEADIAIINSNKLLNNYTTSTVKSTLERRVSNAATGELIQTEGKLGTVMEGSAKVISKATQAQAQAAHNLATGAKENLKSLIDDLNSELRHFDTVGGLLQAGIGSLFKDAFKIKIDDSDLVKLQKNRNQILLGDVIKASFQTAQLAMQTYFDNELAAIQRNKDAQSERIDIDTAQLKARAQSQAESDTLDRQAAQKKKQLDKEAGEETKRVKIAELKISFATELANIAASAAANPLNAITFGAAGIAMYAALAALAYVRYALNLSAIQSAQFAQGIRLTAQNVDKFLTGGRVTEYITSRKQVVLRNEDLYERGGQATYKGRDKADIIEIMHFERGGQATIAKQDNKQYLVVNNAVYEKDITKRYSLGGSPDMETIRGGIVKGRSHAQGGNKFIFKGRIFEDEVDEINIIRTKNAPRGKRYTITGTIPEIASQANVIGGGVGFAPGGVVERIFQTGGILSNTASPAFTLQAPNPESIIRPTGSDGVSKDIAALTDYVRNIGKKVDEQTENINTLAWQTNTRIDKLKVQVVAKEVTSIDKDNKRASAIGRL